uniref:Uncharacterized protein n=1 Tax=Anguilla anguilla TaxID=7936 RepID=A0A0E9SXG5_ANGAN
MKNYACSALPKINLFHYKEQYCILTPHGS